MEIRNRSYKMYQTVNIKRLSHKKFNTTNGLNGLVVTGTQVSLEFLQINR